MHGGKGPELEGHAEAVARKVNTTLGDLIAAAFDIVGDEVKSVARLVSSSNMAKLTGRRILLF